jgi:hypothetical protein
LFGQVLERVFFVAISAAGVQVDDIRMHPFRYLGVIFKLLDGILNNRLSGGGEEDKLVRMECRANVVFTAKISAGLKSLDDIFMTRKSADIVSDFMMGFQGKDLAVDSEIENLVYFTINQGLQKRFGIMETDFGQVIQLFFSGKPAEIFRRCPAECDGFVFEYAAESKTDHLNQNLIFYDFFIPRAEAWDMFLHCVAQATL